MKKNRQADQRMDKEKIKIDELIYQKKIWKFPLKEDWQWTPRPELQLGQHAQTLLQMMYEQKR